MGAKFEEQVAEVTPSELPLERAGHGFVVPLEAQEPLLELGQGAEVIGGQPLALEDREVDLDLVEPTGVHRRMHRDDRGICQESCRLMSLNRLRQDGVI